MADVRGVFGDPWAVVITLRRRRKKRDAVSVDKDVVATTTNAFGAFAISPVATGEFTSNSWSAASIALGVGE
jgi:hypothetical protein